MYQDVRLCVSLMENIKTIKYLSDIKLAEWMCCLLRPYCILHIFIEIQKYIILLIHLHKCFSVSVKEFVCLCRGRNIGIMDHAEMVNPSA